MGKELTLVVICSDNQDLMSNLIFWDVSKNSAHLLFITRDRLNTATNVNRAYTGNLPNTNMYTRDACRPRVIEEAGT